MERFDIGPQTFGITQSIDDHGVQAVDRHNHVVRIMGLKIDLGQFFIGYVQMVGNRSIMPVDA